MGGLVQEIGHPLCKYEGVSSNPSPTKKEKRRKKGKKREREKERKKRSKSFLLVSVLFSRITTPNQYLKMPV
jgi:hypothetical protein